MKKKRTYFSFIIIAAILFFTPVVYADDSGEQRVTLGADLDADQIIDIYDDFDISRGDVKELFVTNDEERKYLSGLVSDERIGKHALSSIYITILGEDEGIHVTTYHINWCTEEMYESALETAGITDAKIIISAPFDVSGTAALTGIYKAYSDITGVPMREVRKSAGVEELVVTGELADVVGSDEAVELVNELKAILDQTKDMSDEELEKEILAIAEQHNLSLTDDNIRQIISLTRTLEKVDFTDWQARALKFSAFMEAAQKAGDGVTDFFQTIGDFFVNLGNSFKK